MTRLFPFLRHAGVAVKYVISGVLALGADTATFLGFRLIGLPIVSANPAGRLVGAAAAFLLNRNWTFRREQPGGWRAEALRYAILWIAATVVSTVLLSWLSSLAGREWEPPAKVGVEIVIMCVNFFISRLWVFAAGRDGGSSQTVTTNKLDEVS